MGLADLKSFLAASTTDRVVLSFRQVSILLGGSLPPALRGTDASRTALSTDDDFGSALRDVGFAPAEIGEERIVFERIAELEDEVLEAAMEAPRLDATGRPRRRHPAFGALKGAIAVAPGYDLTQSAADPKWLAEYHRD